MKTDPRERQETLLSAAIGRLFLNLNQGDAQMFTDPHRSRPRRLPRPTGGRRPEEPGSTVAPTAADDTHQLLYTPAEAAMLLRVRESWLRRRAAARQVPCTLLGKHLRFSASDLATIVTQAAQPPVGRRPRRHRPTIRDADLPTRVERSVDPPDRDDHNRPDGSSPWHG